MEVDFAARHRRDGVFPRLGLAELVAEDDGPGDRLQCSHGALRQGDLVLPAKQVEEGGGEDEVEFAVELLLCCGGGGRRSEQICDNELRVHGRLIAEELEPELDEAVADVEPEEVRRGHTGGGKRAQFLAEATAEVEERLVAVGGRGEETAEHGRVERVLGDVHFDEGEHAHAGVGVHVPGLVADALHVGDDLVWGDAGVGFEDGARVGFDGFQGGFVEGFLFQPGGHVGARFGGCRWHGFWFVVDVREHRLPKDFQPFGVESLVACRCRLGDGVAEECCSLGRAVFERWRKCVDTVVLVHGNLVFIKENRETKSSLSFSEEKG